MSYIYNLTDTWNAAGTTFAAIKMAVTNTASASGSKLLDLSVSGATTSSFVVTKSGDVGIGVSTPNSASGYNWLTIEGPTTGGLISLSAATVELFRAQAIAANSVTLSVQTAIPLLFSTNSTEKMRITSAGDVGIATQLPLEKFHVQGRVLIRGASSGTTATLATDTTALSLVNGTNYNATPSVSLTLGSSNWDSVNLNRGFQWIVTTPSTAGGVALAFNIRSFDGTSTYTTTERARIDERNNILLGTATSPTTATQAFTMATGTAPTAVPADTVTLYSSDLSAGNTMLSYYTEGTSVNANTTAATTHRIAVRVNGTVYYVLANTSA